jgi:glyoxylase-like metal-dependent hydrolase (beta-lactamase superfamily II)
MILASRYPSLTRSLLCCCVGALLCSGAFAASGRIAPGIDVIFGVFVPDQQPDGNSILIRAPEGLIVVDSGRHVQHTQQIIEFARQTGLPIVAIINSHWHLDHIGGDAKLRAAYPNVQIYASDALKEAIGGFLLRYGKYLVDAIQKSPSDPQVQAWRDELAIIETSSMALPTEVITKTAPLSIAGRQLVLHLETNTVTGGDVWVFDPTTRVLIAGDLVTLPVPLLDTACPEHWKSALRHLQSADFKILIPGHGAPMHRREFDRYRHAYDNLLKCAGGGKSKEQCADGWVHRVGNLLENQDRSHAKTSMASYVENSLRANPARIAKLCGD